MLKGRVAEEDLTVQIASKSAEFNDILVVFFKNTALPIKMNIFYSMCDIYNYNFMCHFVYNPH